MVSESARWVAHVMFHMPTTSDRKKVGAVICPPIGVEPDFPLYFGYPTPILNCAKDSRAIKELPNETSMSFYLMVFKKLQGFQILCYGFKRETILHRCGSK